MIFPIGDTNVTGGYKPLFSYLFILVNIVFFLVQVSVEGNLVCDLATIPNDIILGEKIHTLITSMFMHGSWMHLIGNMLFLWVFADNIEAIVGHINFLLFYILGGLFATGLHMFFEIYLGDASLTSCCTPCLADSSLCSTGSIGNTINYCTGSVPSLGASGAISAVLGAYIVLFPKSRIKVFFFITTFTIPALIFLGLWFFEQIVSGISALGSINDVAQGVAWWAHIGGFIFGLAFGFLFRNRFGITYNS